jgi:hypothetical protein
MEDIEISGSVTLTLKIQLLKAEKSAKEVEISQTFKELTQLIFNPLYSAKEIIVEPRNGRRELIDLTKIVLNMGTDYIIEQSFGKRQKFRHFLASIMVEIVSTPLINRNISKLFSGINKQLFEKTENID